MCGIVGYIGENDAKGILLNGLEKLEYRGYDSAGIAVQSTNDLKLFKVKGRIATLREAVDETFDATVGESVIHVGRPMVNQVRRTPIPM